MAIKSFASYQTIKKCDKKMNGFNGVYLFQTFQSLELKKVGDFKKLRSKKLSNLKLMHKK